MRKIIKKLFNTNTGYFLESIPYYYEGEQYIGYVVRRGYIMFGIPGHTKVSIFLNKSDAESHVELWNNLSM